MDEREVRAPPCATSRPRPPPPRRPRNGGVGVGGGTKPPGEGRGGRGGRRTTCVTPDLSLRSPDLSLRRARPLWLWPWPWLWAGPRTPEVVGGGGPGRTEEGRATSHRRLGFSPLVPSSRFSGSRGMGRGGTKAGALARGGGRARAAGLTRPSQVQAQIGQMVEFIRKEAQEKASEIKAAAEEEYAIEKQVRASGAGSGFRAGQGGKMLTLRALAHDRGRDQPHQERVREQGFADGDQEEDRGGCPPPAPPTTPCASADGPSSSPQYATQLNSEKLRVLQAREDALCAVVDDAHMKLAAMSKPGPAYEKLLTDLIVQSFQTLGGDSPAIVKCRAVDLPVVQKVAPAAVAKFAASSGTKVEVSCVADLPPPPTADLDVAYCSGGVIVTNSTGKIKSNNTLDARLAITRQAILPKLREELFGLVAKDR